MLDSLRSARTLNSALMGSEYTDSQYHKAAGFSSMTATDYSDATPDVAITYDALGRQHTVQSAVAQSQFAYDAATLALAQETITYTVPGLAPFTRQLDRRQDALGRATGYTLVDAGSAGGGTGSPALPGKLVTPYTQVSIEPPKEVHPRCHPSENESPEA